MSLASRIQEKAKDALKFDSSLWPRFTQYNPCSFYRLDEQIERLLKNIVDKRKLEATRKKMPKLTDKELKLITQEAVHIRHASRPHHAHKETRWLG